MTISTRLQGLIESLESAVINHQKITPNSARELVLNANIQVEDLMPFANYDHPVEDCYGRAMVHHGEGFEIMVMSWKPGDYSSIHNHGYTEWGVVQTFGNTLHLLYNLKDDKLSLAKKEILVAGAAVKVNNALIHQMGNATTDPYLTLHVYGSNTKEEDITADAKNFDLAGDQVIYTCGGAFFNLPEEAIHSTEPGVVPTREVFTFQAHLMMEYYNRQLQNPTILKLKRELWEKLEALNFVRKEKISFQ